MAPIRLATTVLVGFINPSPQKAIYTNTAARIGNPHPLSLIRKDHIQNNSNHDFFFKCRSQSKISSSKLHMTAASAFASVLPAGFHPEAFLYMALLALQFACQPILTKRFTPKSINRSTVVMSQDITKFTIASTALYITGSWTKAIAGWSVRSWLTVAGLPAALYCVQNFCTLIAYQNLPPLTFNVLNQTKTLSAALCCYILMGKIQSKMQIASLFLLFLSACVIEKLIPLKNKTMQDNKSQAIEEKSSNSDDVKNEKSVHGEGVLAVLAASFISGLAGALTQKSLQKSRFGVGRNSYLFSMEIGMASLIMMCISLIRSNDGKRIRSEGFFHNWTPQTLIPIITNAAGAILVGLVIKYSGAVKKGFALIFGLIMSGLFQACLSNDDDEAKLTVEQVVGGLLAAVSLWMYNSFPAA